MMLTMAAVMTVSAAACAQNRGEKRMQTDSKALVVYFSATGTTARAARTIAEATGGTLYEIVPQQAYTSDDLDWRNRQSRKYVSTKGTWVDNYLSAENTTTKMSTDPYEFIELTHDQVAIKYNDGASDNYLFVADSAQNVPTFDKYNLADSRWAWFVSDPNGTPVSIKDITADKNAEISVENRQIKVNGTDQFEVFDIEGRQLDSKGTRQPGIYIVVVNNVAYKVAVE